MKKILILCLLLYSCIGYSQIIRTLSNVNNTADSLKPVSTPQQNALNLKQNLLSGTGFVKSTSGVISYDNSTYLTTVPAQSFSSLTGKPTTIAGYGITDFNTLGDARYSLTTHTHLFSAITSKPTTLSGYGITDAYPLTGNPSNFLTGITSTQVTTALGFTPYNATNPSSYTTLSAVGAVYATIASPVHTGDIETTTVNAGVILKAPNGTRFKITISNAGDIVATQQ